MLENDPAILKYLVNNNEWFWAGSGNSIACSYRFDLPGRPNSAWVRLSSLGEYKIGVNGEEIGIDYGYKNLLEPGTQGNKILYIADIKNELKQGSNTINITSFISKTGKGLYIDGLIAGKDWERKISFKDFDCHDPVSLGLLDKNIMTGSAGSIDQKIFLKNPDKFLLTVSGILKLLFISVSFSVLLFVFVLWFGKKAVITPAALSFTFLLPTLYMLSLIFLSFDLQLSSFKLYRPALVLFSPGLLFFLWAVSLIFKNIQIKQTGTLAIYFALIAILFVGLFLRLQNIDTEGLHWDEAQMSEKVSGVFKRGYPSLEFSDKTPRYISTSELLVYIQTLSVSLLGENIFSLRMPSVIFGILTVLLLFYFGRLMGGYRVGLLASAAYAVLPPAIGMSVFARYPSQLTFFSLLSVFLFIKYVYSQRLIYWVLSLFSLVFSYFSWQASAFLAVPVIISRFFTGCKNRLKRDTAYFLLILTFPVLVHIVIKKLSRMVIDDYSLLGPSLSLTSFKFNFISSYYDPLFYIDNFMFVEGFHLFALLFFIGLPVLFTKIPKRWELVFLYSIIIFISFIMTAVLANNSYRYAFYLTPFLLIIAATVIIYMTDLLYGSGDHKGFRILNFVFVFIFFILFSSGLTSFQKFPLFREGLKTNLQLRNFPDFDNASVLLNQYVKNDDVVITMVPHLNNYYFDKLDYFFESRLQVAVFKKYKDGSSAVYHKVVPIPAILSLGELKNVIYSAKGDVWLVASPEKYKLFDQETIDFLKKNRRLIYESYDTRIYLMNK